MMDRLLQETNFCETILDTIPDEVMVFDMDANLLWCNPAAERSEGFTLAQAKGRSLFELYDFSSDLSVSASPIWIALTRRQFVKGMVCAYQSQGCRRIKSIDSLPVMREGDLVAVCNVMRDITDIPASLLTRRGINTVRDSAAPAGVDNEDVLKDEAFSTEKIRQKETERERNELEGALRHTGGNISKAARMLGISRQLMQYRMKKHGIR